MNVREVKRLVEYGDRGPNTVVVIATGIRHAKEGENTGGAPTAETLEVVRASLAKAEFEAVTQKLVFSGTEFPRHYLTRDFIADELLKGQNPKPEKIGEDAFGYRHRWWKGGEYVPVDNEWWFQFVKKAKGIATERPVLASDWFDMVPDYMMTMRSTYRNDFKAMLFRELLPLLTPEDKIVGVSGVTSNVCMETSLAPWSMIAETPILAECGDTFATVWEMDTEAGTLTQIPVAYF